MLHPFTTFYRRHLRRRRTRYWQGFESFDGNPTAGLGRIAVLISATVGLLEKRGDIIDDIRCFPAALAGGVNVLINIVYRTRSYQDDPV